MLIFIQKIFSSRHQPNHGGRKVAAYLFLLLCCTPLQAQQLSPADAAESARHYTDGKILKVKPIGGEKIDYRVKILSPQGRVRNIIIDGDSGEMLNKKQRHKQLDPDDKKSPTGL